MFGVTYYYLYSYNRFSRLIYYNCVMSNNIIMLSFYDEGDNPIDPWVLYPSNADKYSDKNYVPPKGLSKNDPFQIGVRYTTPLVLTPFKDDQTKYGNSPIGVKGL